MSEGKPEAVQPKPECRRLQLSLRTVLLFVTLCAIVFSGLAYLWQRRGEQSSREDLDNVSQSLTWCVSYEGHLPPAYVMDSTGRRMHSWRAFIFRVVAWRDFPGSGSTYKFSEPWDSPDNTRFREMGAYGLYYSSSFYADGSRNATYLCVVGGALWPIPKRRGDDWNVSPSAQTWKEGGVLPSKGKALLLVEVVESEIPWTKPEDIGLSEIASLLREDTSGDRFRRRIRHVVAVDAAGARFILDPMTDIEEIKELVESEAAHNS